MKRVIFAGPSIWGIDEEQLGGIKVRPPAQRGDILSAMREGVGAIAIVDGFFGHCPSVGHKEILFALSQGIQVLGGASMGALRAAECASYGMIGIGGIYQDFLDGTLVSDSDVAVLHAPEHMHFKPLTIALVDIEETLNASDFIEDNTVKERLRRTARDLHYSQRSWQEIAVLSGQGDEVIALLEENSVSRKRNDAIETIGALKLAEPRSSERRFDFTESFVADKMRFGKKLSF